MQQALQVFIEELGPLKDFIKAKNPATLKKVVQASREEERGNLHKNQKNYMPYQKRWKELKPKYVSTVAGRDTRQKIADHKTKNLR